MAENDDSTPDDGPVAPAAAAAAAPASAEPVSQAPPGLTARVWSFRAMVAVALASLVIGGGIGSAIAAVAGDDEPDHRVRMGRFSDGNGGPPGAFPDERGFGDRMPGGPGGGMREFRQEFGEGIEPEDLERLQELRKEMREEMREQMQEWRRELQEQRDGANDDAPGVDPSPSAS